MGNLRYNELIRDLETRNGELFDEVCRLKSEIETLCSQYKSVGVTRIGKEPHNYGLLDIEWLRIVPQGTILYVSSDSFYQKPLP